MDLASDYVFMDFDDAFEEVDVESSANPLYEPVNNFSAPSDPFGTSGLPASSSFSFGSGLPPPPVFSPRAPEPKNPKLNTVVKTRKLNTNALVLKLGTLATDVTLSTGDPVFCSQCSAALNQNSKLSPVSNTSTLNNSDSRKEWICEFCHQINQVSLLDEEIPTSDSTDYILEPPSVNITSQTTDDSTIIFCIDISGSMTMSYEIDGKVKLRGNERVDRLSSLNVGKEDQFLPGQKRNVTYVSRLQCLQAAIDSQLEELAKTNPNRRVGIVTFNGEVNVLGDGTQLVRVITGDKLDNYDELIAEGANHENWIPVSQSQKILSTKLFALEESGPTALGPALVISASIASKKAGSKIVICTDGLANVGIGSLSDLNTEQEKEAFYNKVGEFAKEHGVTISVISIRGTDCRIENLGILTDTTSGNVNIVDPLNIASEFQSIMSVPTIATNVSATVLLHKGLFIQNTLGEGHLNRQNRVERDVGNVTVDSDLTYEYGVLSRVELEKIVDLTKVKALPFQLQVRFTKLDGMKCIRTITKMVPITFEREVAEQAANIDVLGLAGVQQPAMMAQYGDYEGSRAHNMNHARLLQRVAQNQAPAKQQDASIWLGHQQKMESELRTVTHNEAGSSLFNDDVMDVDSGGRNKEKLKTRKAVRTDETSNALYNMKQFSYAKKKK